MVASIVGARFLADAVKISEMKDGGPAHYEFGRIRADIVKLILTLYLVAGVYSPMRLFSVFSYDKPVIVGLSGIWAGFLLILIMGTYLDLESAVKEGEIDADELEDVDE